MWAGGYGLPALIEKQVQNARLFAQMWHRSEAISIPALVEKEVHNAGSKRTTPAQFWDRSGAISIPALLQNWVQNGWCSPWGLGAGWLVKLAVGFYIG